LVFYERGSVDWRGKLAKTLKPKAKEFKLLSKSELTPWIKQYVQTVGGQIEGPASFWLAENLGADLWRLSNELSKLIFWRKNQIITIDDVKDNVASEFDPNIFDMVDQLGEGNRKRALALLEQFLNRGENELYLLSMITRQFRNLIIAAEIHQQRAGNWQLASKLKIPAFVATKLTHQQARFSFGQLRKIYQKILSADLAIKTGKMTPKTILSLLVLGLCS
jgi:DNA polymerase-3 subunit delta